MANATMTDIRRENEHIILVPLPYQGHINPMLQLGKALRSRHGFSITIAHTAYNAPDPSLHPEFAFFPMPDGLPEREYTVVELVAGDVMTVNENCRESLRGFLARMKEERVIRCVVSDELMYFAEDVAADLSLPSLILRTASAATAFARLLLVKLTHSGRLPSQDHASDDLVPEMPPLRFKDLPFTLTVFKNFSTLMDNAYKDRKSGAIIWNTSSCLEQSNLEKLSNESRVPIFAIGPIHMASGPVPTSLLDEDRGCLQWLDGKPPGSVLFVSCTGSVGSLTGREMGEIAHGLARSQQAFLWAVRPDSVRGSSEWARVVSGVGERGLAVKWAPQKEVLRHGAVGGFWSHCGWNSTLESLSEGVPMICRPCFGDQRVNARYLTHVWRVGIELDGQGLERGEIERAVRRLMAEEEGNRMRERASEWKRNFELTTTQGGDSYQCFTQLLNFIDSL